MKFENPKSFQELVGFNPPTFAGGMEETHATTVITIRFDQGVLMFADRRATMGNLIVYEKAEKIFALDDSTLIAISGSFAKSLEICRFLRHSFQYFRRTQLQEMSLEGKLNEVSRALAGNMANAMNGFGVFVPVMAAYDTKDDLFSVYTFDTAGARFEGADYAAAGSGSERIRGIFEYIADMHGPWNKRKKADVIAEGLRLLRIAAELDSATGGMQANLPMIMEITREGVQPISEKEFQTALRKIAKN